MELVPAIDLIKEAYNKSYAIPSFCVWNGETIDIVLRTAEKMKAPLLLMTSPVDLSWHTPRQIFEMVQALGRDYNCRVAVHLDHGDTPQRAQDCIQAGYTSVMLDYSMKSYGENVEGMKRVTAMAKPAGVTVEGEIGHVGQATESAAEGSGDSKLSDPDTAERFCRETGIDMVAISIGNAHGSYVKLPRFDFELLETLKKRLGIPLVLHGGSGTPPDDIRRAISLGIAKINIATDFINAIKNVYLAEWQSGKWLPSTLPAAMEAGQAALEKWISIMGCAGKAG